MVTIAERLAQIERELSKKTLKVGFMQGAMYDTDYPNFGGKNNRQTRKVIPVAQVAFWAEYGTVTAPARPFFRIMIDNNKRSWGRMLKAQFDAGNYEDMFDLLGEEIKMELFESITELQIPALSPVTVALRLAAYSSQSKAPNMATIAKPLIFTSHMLNSIAWEVGSD